MEIKLLRAKIHHATVTHTNPDYHGSITVPRSLLKVSGLLPNEAVLVADTVNGNRFETYIIAGAPGEETIEVNGGRGAPLWSGTPGDHHELCFLRSRQRPVALRESRYLR